jgi:four helix bundle protein
MNTLNRAKQLQARTKRFAVRIIKTFARLPKDEAACIIGRQSLRSGTSLVVNYRASCRARSTADFISKISVVRRSRRNAFCLEVLVESDLVPATMVESLMSEWEELLKIFSASLVTAKSNR